MLSQESSFIIRKMVSELQVRNTGKKREEEEEKNNLLFSRLSIFIYLCKCKLFILYRIQGNEP